MSSTGWERDHRIIDNENVTFISLKVQFLFSDLEKFHGCNYTHCGPVTRYDVIELWKIRSSNGMSPGGTEQLLESMLTYCQWDMAFTWRKCLSKCLRYRPLIWVWKALIYGCSCISQKRVCWQNMVDEIPCDLGVFRGYVDIAAPNKS